MHGIEQGSGLRHAQHDRQVGAAFGPGGRGQPLNLDAEHLPAEEQDGAHGLILRAGRHAPVDGEMGREVTHGGGLDAGMGRALPLRDVGQEPSDPVGVAALGARGVVPCSDALPEQVERSQGMDVAVLVDDRTGGRAMPVGALEEVDKVDAEGLFGLADLPLLTPIPFEVLAESAYLVRHGLVRRRPCQESADPPHAVRSGLVLDQLGFQDELAKLLQRRLELPHGAPPSPVPATSMPLGHVRPAPRAGPPLGCTWRVSRRSPLRWRPRLRGNGHGVHGQPAIGAFRLSAARRAYGARTNPWVTTRRRAGSERTGRG